MMKRLSLIAMLLLGSALNAHADQDIYTDTARHPRGDAVLQADTNDCSTQLASPDRIARISDGMKNARRPDDPGRRAL
jgi:hypothetical protein